ncbi:MAG: hypothetical protein C4294_08055 [Nitrospiraceae bacterium]
MNKIPFSVYDFFGYLASGFLMIIAMDYSFASGNHLLRGEIGLILGIFWIIVAYILGHIISNISSYLVEKKLVRHVLHSPEEKLFEEFDTRFWRHLFPGYFEPLPKETKERVLLKAKAKAGIGVPGRGLFFPVFTRICNHP